MAVRMRTRDFARIALVVVTAFALVVSASAPQAHVVGVSASAPQVMQVDFAAPGSGSSLPVTLLRGTFTNSKFIPDGVVDVRAECALWTDIASPESHTAAQVTIWVELDGVPVPVSRDSNGDGIANDPDDGKVVWCNRAFKTAAPALDVTGLYQRSRATSGFRWMVLAVPSGTHTLEVKAQLDATVTDVGTFAQAVVGKRVLIAWGSEIASDNILDW